MTDPITLVDGECGRAGLGQRVMGALVLPAGSLTVCAESAPVLEHEWELMARLVGELEPRDLRRALHPA